MMTSDEANRADLGFWYAFVRWVPVCLVLWIFAGCAAFGQSAPGLCQTLEQCRLQVAQDKVTIANLQKVLIQVQAQAAYSKAQQDAAEAQREVDALSPKKQP